MVVLIARLACRIAVPDNELICLPGPFFAISFRAFVEQYFGPWIDGQCCPWREIGIASDVDCSFPDLGLQLGSAYIQVLNCVCWSNEKESCTGNYRQRDD